MSNLYSKDRYSFFFSYRRKENGDWAIWKWSLDIEPLWDTLVHLPESVDFIITEEYIDFADETRPTYAVLMGRNGLNDPTDIQGNDKNIIDHFGVGENVKRKGAVCPKH